MESSFSLLHSFCVKSVLWHSLRTDSRTFVSASLGLSLYSRLPCLGLTSGHALSGRSQRLMKTGRTQRSSWPSASRPNHHPLPFHKQLAGFKCNRKIFKSMCVYTRHDDWAHNYEDFFIQKLCMIYNFCLFFLVLVKIVVHMIGMTMKFSNQQFLIVFQYREP